VICRAARFAGVAPWEMEDRLLTDSDGDYWLARLLAAEGAENDAREAIAKRQQARRGALGRG
jgi:hypothetical protein